MITPTWPELEDFCSELYDRSQIRFGQQQKYFCSEYYNFGQNFTIFGQKKIIFENN